MKLIKYLLTPLKILVFLVVILSLVYFRNVIFLPNINQYVDDAQNYIEEEFAISIPVYVSESIVETKAIGQADSPVVKDDVCNDNSVTSTVDDAVKSVITTDFGVTESLTTKDTDEEPVIVEAADKSVDTSVNEDVPVMEVSENSEVATVNSDLLTQLNETVNLLNTKVDKLFNEGKKSVEAVFDSSEVDEEASSVDVKEAPIVKVVPEESVSNLNEDKTNVHLTEDAKRMFFMARQMYWMGDALTAEKLYLKLADIENDNPDIYGELGNVYYSQGKWNEAGKAYYEAAIRLMDLDRNNQVNYLLRVIQGLDSDSAEKLKQKISS